MYLKHFGLEKNPFSLTPDPRFLFLTAQHREALAALLFAVAERKGFMVMTGDAGTGKTTLVRKLLSSIPETCAQFSVVVNPALTRSELLECVLLDFGERDVPASKAVRLSLLRKFLLRTHAENRTAVLVIDEAHLLTPELVDEVRLLSNFETAEQKLLQIILVGQDELDTILGLESMRQVTQRIAIRTHIVPLAAPEVKRYLQSRWTRSSPQHPLPFTEEAIALITTASKGIPRVINVICDAALVNACGVGTHAIGLAEIKEVLRDLTPGLPECSPSPEIPPIPKASVPKMVALDQTAVRSTPDLPSLERYVSAKRPASGIWKFATWFRAAHSGAE